MDFTADTSLRRTANVPPGSLSEIRPHKICFEVKSHGLADCLMA